MDSDLDGTVRVFECRMEQTNVYFVTLLNSRTRGEMQKIFVIMSATFFALVAGVPADAKGCIKGAFVGGAIGHYAGHHTALGAVAGCIIGRHESNKRDRAGQPPGMAPISGQYR
jgi:outer membrane lipoprotein SlyB